MTDDFDVERLRATLIRRGVRVTLADTVRPVDAARFLGKAPRTLANWRAAGIGPDFIRIGGRCFYALRALISFIESERQRSNRPETSRTNLDERRRPADDGGMHISSSRLSTSVPQPVADVIRRLAKERGTQVGELLSDALRHYRPIEEAMNDTSRKPDAKS